MSYTEINIGKVREVALNGRTPEEWAQKECERLNASKNYADDTWLSALNDYWDSNADFGMYGKYIISGDRLFEILENKCEEATEDISILTPNSDGTYNYIMQFYNGGCCLSEALEYELDKLPKK